MNQRQAPLAILACSVLAACIACTPAARQEPPADSSPAPVSQASPAPAPAQELPARPSEVAQTTPRPTREAPPPPPSAPRRTERAPAPVPVEHRPAETPVVAPAPAPQAVVVTVPAGTPLDLILLNGVSSQTSQVGDSIRARVAHDVMQNGTVVIPSGSVVVGTVTEAVPLKKIGGTAKLALSISTLELPSGGSVPIEAVVVQQGKSETKKDAATIGGAAAGGAVLGRILGKDTKGALIGAVAGAAAGTAIASKTKGEQVELPVGTEMTIELNRPAEVTVRR